MLSPLARHCVPGAHALMTHSPLSQVAKPSVTHCIAPVTAHVLDKSLRPDTGLLVIAGATIAPVAAEDEDVIELVAASIGLPVAMATVGVVAWAIVLDETA